MGFGQTFAEAVGAEHRKSFRFWISKMSQMSRLRGRLDFKEFCDCSSSNSIPSQLQNPQLQLQGFHSCFLLQVQNAQKTRHSDLYIIVARMCEDAFEKTQMSQLPDFLALPPPSLH